MSTSPHKQSLSLSTIQTTPFPNRLLDCVIRLPEPQARIVCLIVRRTLGWHMGQANKRRACVRLTYRRILQAIDMSSPTTVGRAVEALVSSGILEVMTEQGALLNSPEQRRGYHRALFYRINHRFIGGPTSPVDNPVDGETPGV